MFRGFVPWPFFYNVLCRAGQNAGLFLHDLSGRPLNTGFIRFMDFKELLEPKKMPDSTSIFFLDLRFTKSQADVKSRTDRLALTKQSVP